jgi:hypothetical protein
LACRIQSLHGTCNSEVGIRIVAVHAPDLQTGQHTITQLTDETIPSEQDAGLIALRYFDTNKCRQQLLSGLSTSYPNIVPIMANEFTQVQASYVLIVERNITWAEFARRTQAIAKQHPREARRCGLTNGQRRLVHPIMELTG